MVDYTTTAKWGEAPTPPYSHIYIDTYNLIQHTPTKSSPHTVSLPQCSCLKSHRHFTYCSVLSRAMVSSFMCVYMWFFLLFFFTTHIVVTMLGAWSLNLERDRETHTHLLALNRKSDKQKVPGYQSQHTRHLVNDAANTTSPVRGEIWQ